MGRRHIVVCVLSTMFWLFCLPVNSRAIFQGDKQLGSELDKIFAREFKPDAPGCAVLVARNGLVIYEEAYGLANLELNVPNTAETVFEIASNTKQFTAVAIMQLVEQGKISLQDSIGTYIPDYPTGGYVITIEHLLTHTSGIADYLAMEEFDSTVWRLDTSPIDFINIFKRDRIDFEPGTDFGYSNSGYFLLGYIIEEASGVSYRKYMEDNIFIPAGMTNSYYNDHEAIIYNRASGYTKGSDGFENAEYVSSSKLYSAGALVSTVDDYFKYYQALDAYKLVSKKSLEKIRTSYTLKNGSETGYGYGVQVRDLRGYCTIAHAGGGPGSWSMHWYFPLEDVHFIVFTNCEEYISKDALVFDLAILAAGGSVPDQK